MSELSGVTSELAMGLVDGCPECVRNVEAPLVASAVEGGWRCSYECADCGHMWTTDWAEKALVLSGSDGVFTQQKWDNWGTSKSAPAGVGPPVVPGLTATKERLMPTSTPDPTDTPTANAPDRP